MLPDPDGLLTDNAISRCHVNIEYFGSATVICPRKVDGTEYVLHPRPNSYEKSDLNTYVGHDGGFRSVNLNKVIVTDTPAEFASVVLDQSQTTIHINLSVVGLFHMNERRLMFICGPRDLDFTNALQRQLDRLNRAIHMEEIPWEPTTALTEEIKKVGGGLGVFFLYRGNAHLPLQGCGSRPSPLFAAHHEATADDTSEVTSCVVDPMTESRIGFLCEGRLEPEDCMKCLIDPNGENVIPPTPHLYMEFDHNRPWVVAKYFKGFDLPPFGGECRCIDPETGDVKAKIEIRTKTDYVCDIASMIFRNRVRPISGHWCSVVLHPGSTLTIRFPAQAVDTGPSDNNSSASLVFKRAPKYLFKTDISPKDLNMLRQLNTIYEIDVYDEILHHKVIAGDALELDVSQILRGEMKLTYHPGKPLALIAGTNSFFFHWILKAINKYTFKSITAAVNISFAFTHNYRILGCESGAESVFDPDISRTHCSTKSMGNGIGNVYECTFPIEWGNLNTGIHCQPDGELLPNNCESTGYDLYSNSIILSPEPVFDIQLNDDTPISYACVCVDQFGYETSRLILERNKEYYHTYHVFRQEDAFTFPPYVLIPWSDADLSSDGLSVPKSPMIRNISPETVILHVGTSLFMHCYPGEQNVGNNERITTTWLPRRFELFYYSINDTLHGYELTRNKYENSISTTPGALDFTYLTIGGTTVYQTMVLTSHRSAIIISKHTTHKQFVPITFVCGKTPETSDLSVTDDVTTTKDYPRSGSDVMELSKGYTWNVVKIYIETTDPYMQGCGVTSSSDKLFKPETHKLYDDNGQEIGCMIDLQFARKAAFYCPVPYVLEPSYCFDEVLVDGIIKNISEISQSLVASRTNHFVTLKFDNKLVGAGETLRQTPPLECRCVTIKGVILSTIQIENYYAK
ncbi:hypothetical protein BBBOND_0313340 [Babesia bigemina]|uniref:6-Cys domain-containing protein n=1 Tax=Babesia bigemina TaxID=5866 RepID=A0A061DBT7_BABBI|nr:hypothetical protein BBBOND_0313340 [Babesia bigemina]CDR97432.1 hypothetical protein BBBOND_0313340 [Babesia bigemina]|eukprot:XP_012769618.1 hypothetical protein BBBOND_0313340 [Babesia bigemina]